MQSWQLWAAAAALFAAITALLTKLGVQGIDAGLATLVRTLVGDALAWCLRAVGITEARVERCLGGASCGCDGRRRWLNRWGLLAVDRLERVLNSWARFTVGP